MKRTWTRPTTYTARRTDAARGVDLLVVDHCQNERCGAPMLHGDGRQSTTKYCSSACRKAVQMRGYRARRDDTPEPETTP